MQVALDAFPIASLVAVEKITASAAVLPIMVGLTTNTITKAVVAITTGDRRSALQVIPGLVVVIVAAWMGLMLSAL